jgi:hypothetical protein
VQICLDGYSEELLREKKLIELILASSKGNNVESKIIEIR